AYWKPVETGASDTEAVQRLVPAATAFPPLARFRDPVAPPLAARREGRPMPGVSEIVASRPRSPLPLVVETFGGPLSPLAAHVLQADLVPPPRLPTVLVPPSAVGAIGRTLQAAAGLREFGVTPAAVVLLGPPDDFAAEQIERHAGAPAFSVLGPDGWDYAG